MANENATKPANENYDGLDFDELERILEEGNDFEDELQKQLLERSILVETKEKIGDPDVLGDVILNTIWEQFTNQIAIQAGEDFVKENRGLNLDLRKEAHIQTTENFEKGKVASHNTEIDYEKRYNEWKENFQRDGDTIITKIDIRTGEEKKALNEHARYDYDKGRPKGSKTVHKDHTISAAEIIRDPAAAAHMSKEERIAFANSEKNLVDLDAEANMSKGDSKMEDWLNYERNGKKPAERFNINEEELRRKDKEAREEYAKQKKDAEQRSVDSGKKSQKEEALRVGKKTARAVVMNLLADLVKKIIQRLVKWLKSTGKTLKSLVESIKDAIEAFVKDLRSHVVNVLDSAGTVIATSIFGPVIRVIKKAWMFIKQGWSSLKDAIKYIMDPQNRNKPIGILMLEVGKIIIAGFTAVGAIVLGEAIGVGLSSIPVFAIEIPLFGSLASIIGGFMGAVISGIIGALALNLINNIIAKKKKASLEREIVNKGNEVLVTQEKIIRTNEQKLQITKGMVSSSMKDRHESAAMVMQESLGRILDHVDDDNSEDYSKISSRLDSLLDE